MNAIQQAHTAAVAATERLADLLRDVGLYGDANLADRAAEELERVNVPE